MVKNMRLLMIPVLMFALSAPVFADRDMLKDFPGQDKYHEHEVGVKSKKDQRTSDNPYGYSDETYQRLKDEHPMNDPRLRDRR